MSAYVVASLVIAMAVALAALRRAHAPRALRIERAFKIGLLDEYVARCRADGDFAKALPFTKAVARAEPNNLRARLLHVEVLRALGRRDTAIAHLEDLRALRPANEEVKSIIDELLGERAAELRALGAVFSMPAVGGETPAAIPAVGFLAVDASPEAVIAIRSDDARTNALAYLDDSRFMEALVVCKKLIRLRPDDVDARLLLARVYAAQGKLDEAICGLEELVASGFVRANGDAAAVESAIAEMRARHRS